MADQQRRDPARPRRPSRRRPDAEALGATHQQTVPVLPADPGARYPRDSSATLSATRAHRTLGAVTAARAPRLPRAAPDVERPLPPPDPDLERDAGRDPGEAIPDDRLPAPLALPGSREVALAGPPAAPLLIRGNRSGRAPLYQGVVPRRRRPRSLVLQFLLSMAVAVAVCGAAALATPLGQAAGFGATFQAYASAVPWVPTPTPTPRPTPTPVPAAPQPAPASNPGQQAILSEIASVFGGYAAQADAVARCESGLDPNAWNPYPILDSHASGVFQLLYPSTWDRTPYASDSPYNAAANIRAAYYLFSNDGYTWREWECQP